MSRRQLRHFYIPDDQSIYLLSHHDASKLKRWVKLCQQQLNLLGYENISLIGKGAYGFVFNGDDKTGLHHVFKFSRITLPVSVRNRMADEADIQSQLNHERIPKIYEYRKIKRQSIIHMARVPGVDLEQVSLQTGPLPPETIMSITLQLADILLYMRDRNAHPSGQVYVHGDIKPSNIIYDVTTNKVYLIDWGSSVYAQIDSKGQPTCTNVMNLMSDDWLHTNARMGDVYFIGEEQLNGELSSPRFDEQGLAATIYALASGQSCRYGYQVITPSSLGLPKMLAQMLEGMLNKDPQVRAAAGDYFFKYLPVLKMQYMAKQPTPVKVRPLIPVLIRLKSDQNIDTVVYGSRKSFLRRSTNTERLANVDDVQLEKYYKNYLMGMADTEKAFIAAVGRLGRFPVVGGIVVRWEKEGVYIDSNLTLYDPELRMSFKSALNNIINLARGIDCVGMFKSCLFNARDTLHIERADESQPFVAAPGQIIKFKVSDVADVKDASRLHSYFEDGKDPDEYLYLPDEMMAILAELNLIHHTGCIIFEVLPKHMKIHSYLKLFNHDKKDRVEALLASLIALLPTIDSLGLLGFMKLPYKNTRFFNHIEKLPDHFYPKNPKV